MKLVDIQNNKDERNIIIDKVGIADLRYPIVVMDRCKEKQQTIAKFKLSVTLAHDFKGTHMSRFIEVLNEHRGEVTMHTIPVILRDIKARFNAERAHIEVQFPYFLERAAPKSGAKALMDYNCTFIGEANGTDYDFIIGVQIPVVSLCPCSKAISDYGAHNQRGYITIEVRTKRKDKGEMEFVWIEELVEIGEQSASSPVYALLKRPDERHVTMQVYDNPAFVEDVVRNVASRLKRDSRISWFKVHVENHESIHNHNAFAMVEWNRS